MTSLFSELVARDEPARSSNLSIAAEVGRRLSARNPCRYMADVAAAGPLGELRLGYETRLEAMSVLK